MRCSACGSSRSGGLRSLTAGIFPGRPAAVRRRGWCEERRTRRGAHTLGGRCLEPSLSSPLLRHQHLPPQNMQRRRNRNISLRVGGETIPCVNYVPSFGLMRIRLGLAKFTPHEVADRKLGKQMLKRLAVVSNLGLAFGAMTFTASPASGAVAVPAARQLVSSSPSRPRPRRS